MANFLNTTHTYEAIDTYQVNENTHKYWVKATAEISISSEGIGSWTVTMTNDHSEGYGGKGRATLIYLRIGNYYAIHKNKGSLFVSYGEDTTTSKWGTFPTGNNTSRKGSFTLADVGADDNIEVVLRVGCMENSSTTSQKETFWYKREYWTPVSAGIPTIIDNGNNTFSVHCEDALPGINNEVTGQKCFYKFRRYDAAVEVTSGAINLPTTVPASTSSVTVYAYTKATGVYGDPVQSSLVTESIKHYYAPSNAPVGTPFITPQADNRVNLTVKHPWLFWFPVGVDANTSSPIAGYRLQLKVDGVSADFSGTVKENTQINAILNTSGTAYYCDIASDLLDGAYMEAPDPYTKWMWHYVLIDPTTITTINGQPLKGGMKVVMQAKPYTKNGVGTKLPQNNYLSSASSLVHGSGTVQVKKDGSTDSWDECQVWIKLEDNTDSWVEAEGIFVKAADNTDEWTEIQ